VNSAGTAGGSGDGGAAVSARLNQPNGVLVYGGSLLVVDQVSHVVRAVDLSSRIITRWAGTGTASSTGDGLDKLAATFNHPFGIALVDANVLIAQNVGCQVTRITPAGVVRRFAGSGTCSPSNGDGSSALSANVNTPVAMAYDNSTGTVYIAEYNAHKVRKGGGDTMRTCGPSPTRTVEPVLSSPSAFGGSRGLAVPSWSAHTCCDLLP
jgi:hypothetical protein